LSIKTSKKIKKVCRQKLDLCLWLHASLNEYELFRAPFWAKKYSMRSNWIYAVTPHAVSKMIDHFHKKCKCFLCKPAGIVPFSLHESLAARRQSPRISAILHHGLKNFS
jgi:hypothetical protein